MKLSKRLEEIANLINNEEIIDIGCDHALLDIYLTLHKNIKCIASDISDKVLEKAKLNIKKYDLEDKIKVIQSNGLKNIVLKNQTIVIAGMGTHTILDILNDKQINNSLLICSNNDYELLRRKICNKNYYIKEEKAIYDNKHWYIIIRFEKGYKTYSKFDYKIGPLLKNNKEYLEYLYNKYINIYKKIPKKYIIQRIKLHRFISKIKKLLNSF